MYLIYVLQLRMQTNRISCKPVYMINGCLLCALNYFLCPQDMCFFNILQGLSSYSALLSMLHNILYCCLYTSLSLVSVGKYIASQLRIFGKGLYHLLPIRLQPINWPVGALPRDCMLRGQSRTRYCRSVGLSYYKTKPLGRF